MIKIKFILIILTIACVVYSAGELNAQSITNTLGTSGTFTIKNASTNYFTLSQSTGEVNILKSLRLENTTGSTVGVITKNGSRFIHNYGTGNVFMGINSGNFTLTGYNNTCFGNNSLALNTDGHENTAVGFNSLSKNINGDGNTALGTANLENNTTGYSNTSVGSFSLYSNTTGCQNSAFGLNSLASNTTGYENSAFGSYSLNSNITGSYNSAFGWSSLVNVTGDNNTAFGFYSGVLITTGSNLNCFGYDSQPSSGTISNQVTLGDLHITSLRCNVQTITSLSDARDKKNITDLSLGLDFITKLKPRQFNWDRREWYDDNVSDGSKIQEAPTAGFIAQELDKVQTTENAEWLNLVLKDNPEKWEATYGNLLPVMVKAIQELKTENDELKERLNEYEKNQTILSNEIYRINQENQ